MQAGNLSAGKVIYEKDLIVKQVPNLKEPKVKTTKTANLEVAGDQVAVREVPSKQTLVSSSTVVAKTSSHSKKVIQADEMGSEYTIPIALGNSKAPKAKKNAMIIDETTPRNIPEDMTQQEVNKLKMVVKEDESQGAKIVRKVAVQPTVQEIEGITLRKTTSPTEMTITTKTSSGGTPAVSAMEAGVVVAKVGEKITPKTASVKSSVITTEAAKKAEAAKAARKASSAQTQAQVEKAKPKVPVQEDNDFLSMLPDNWADLHWVQKEKFIKGITNIEFLKFILTVESVKAVQDACEKRLKELGGQA
jgi:hypothetical protein